SANTPGGLLGVPRRDLSGAAPLGGEGLPQPDLLQRGREGRPLRRLGRAAAVRRRDARGLQATPRRGIVVSSTDTHVSRPRRNRAHLILRYFPLERKGITIMNSTHARLHPRAAVFAALIALILATAGLTAVDTGVAAAAASRSGGDPIVI